jgi:hypothetical protein
LIELSAGTTHYYRVRAYNGGGAGASSTTITVILPATTSNACAVTLNPAFELSFPLVGGGYLGTNWTEWETYPGVTVGYDETGIVHSGGHSQRLRVGGTNATSGGIYQRIPVTAGQPYSFSVWIYAGDALTACSLGVHPAGGTNAASGVTWTSVNSSQAWVQKTWAGVATSNYLTVFYKVATPDNVKRNGYFDDAGPGTGPLQLAVQAGANGVTLTWPECPGARLEKSSALTTPLSWTTVANGISAGNGQKSLTISPTESAGFFRLVQE